VSRTSNARRALFVAFVATTGCPTPTQYGGPIPIDTSGFEARARMLCGGRAATHAASVCAPNASPEKEARGSEGVSSK
jgi:hypothetical protein